MSDDNFRVPKWNRSVGAVVSAIMVIIGVLMFTYPSTLLLIMCLASASLIVYGVFSIFKYVNMPQGRKEGLLLASGIIISICGLFFLLAPPLTEVLSYSFIVALIAFMVAINQLHTAYLVRKMGGRSGLLTFSGVINIVIGLFFCFFPLIMALSFNYILAIYLIVGGASLFIESFTDNYANK